MPQFAALHARDGVRYRRRVRYLLLAALVACGPGLKGADPKYRARDRILGAVGDASAFEKLIRGPVMNGGLWFESAQCSQFNRPGQIEQAQAPAFARCLATLKLKESAREDALGDVVIMTYEPGFEIEVRVVPENDGPRLTWIGFESRRSDDDNAPTISPDALEALRLAGDRNGPLDPAVAATLPLDPTPKIHAAFTWLKVCVDESGAVSGVYPFETTAPQVTLAFSDAVRGWKFKPFELNGQAMPVCSMARLAYPPGGAPTTEVLPMPPPPSRSGKEPIVFAEGALRNVLEGKRIAGTKTIVPDDDTKGAIRDAKASPVIGTFRLCVDDAGKVESVLPIRSTGFASYDRRILAGINEWRYQPFMLDGAAVPMCTAVTFIYKQY